MFLNKVSGLSFLLRVYIIFLIKHSLLFTEGKECILRRLGFCKVLDITTEESTDQISLSDFKHRQPQGFLLKTSIEINTLENKFSFANNLLIEKNRPIEYDLDNAVLVTVQILMSNVQFNVQNNNQTNVPHNATLMIHLGHKYYGISRFELHFGHGKDRLLYKKIYNSYMPELPKFPYNLHLQITKDGIFTIYADTNTKPFFTYHLDGDVEVNSLSIFGPDRQDDLVLFYDCTMESCGTHRDDKLYDCREWLGRERLLSKNYGNNVLFDEYLFVNLEQTSKITFFDLTQQSEIEIVFRDENIEAKLQHHSIDTAVVAKTAFTKQWFEVPASPYAVHVKITNGARNNYLNITNIRGDKILSLNLCEKITMLDHAELRGRKLYYDCIHPANIEEVKNRRADFEHLKSRCEKVEKERLEQKQKKYGGCGRRRRAAINVRVLCSIVGRRRREIDECEGIKNEYEYGFNFTKLLVDKRQYVSEPFVLYEHKFGNTLRNSLEDWCGGVPEPKVYDKLQTGCETLQSVNEISSKAILCEFKKISAQIDATVSKTESTNKELLFEFKKLSSQIEGQINKTADSNKAILSELQNISGQNAVQINTTDNTNKAIILELENIKKSIVASISNTEQNAEQNTEQNTEQNNEQI